MEITIETILTAAKDAVRPELLVLIPVLYAIGYALKKAETVKDKHIPVALGCIGIALAALWIIGTTTLADPQDIILAIFAAITQGILVAGAAVYCNQVAKQHGKADATDTGVTVAAADLETRLRVIALQLALDPDQGATVEDLLDAIEAATTPVP